MGERGLYGQKEGRKDGRAEMKEGDTKEKAKGESKKQRRKGIKGRVGRTGGGKLERSQDKKTRMDF